MVRTNSYDSVINMIIFVMYTCRTIHEYNFCLKQITFIHNTKYLYEKDDFKIDIEFKMFIIINICSLI